MAARVHGWVTTIDFAVQAGTVALSLVACASPARSDVKSRNTGDATAFTAACLAADAGPPTSMETFVTGILHSYSYTALGIDEMNAVTEAVRALDEADQRGAADAAAHAGYRLGALTTAAGCYWVLEPPGFPGAIEQAVIVFAPSWKRDLVVEVPHAHEDHNTDGEGALIFEAVGAKVLVVSGSHRCVQAVATSGCHPSAECSHRDVTTGTTPAVPPSDSDPAHAVHNAVNATHLAYRTTPATILQIHSNLHPELNGDSLVSNATRYVIPNTPADALYAALRSPDVDVRSCNDPTAPPMSGAFCGEINVQGLASNGAADPCHGRGTSNGSGTDHRFIHLEQSNARLCTLAELDTNPSCLSSFEEWASRLSAAILTAIPVRR